MYDDCICKSLARDMGVHDLYQVTWGQVCIADILQVKRKKKTHRQLYANFSYHGSLMKASCFHEIIMWKRKPPCHRLHHLLDELRFSDLILLMGKRNIKQILYVEKNEPLLNMCLYVNVNAHVTEVHRIYFCDPYLNEEWATFIVYAIEELCSEIYFLLYE